MMFDKLVICDRVGPVRDGAVTLLFEDEKDNTKKKVIWIRKDEVASLIKRLAEMVPQGPEEPRCKTGLWDAMTRRLKKARLERDQARVERQEAVDCNLVLQRELADAEIASSLVSLKKDKEETNWAKMVNRVTDENIRLQTQLDEAEECAEVEPLHGVESLLETAKVMLAASEKERDELKEKLESLGTERNRFKSERDMSWRHLCSLRGQLKGAGGAVLADDELLGALDQLVGERDELKEKLEAETEWNKLRSERVGSWKYFRSLRVRLGDVAGKTLEDGELLGILDWLVRDRDYWKARFKNWTARYEKTSSLLEEARAKLESLKGDAAKDEALILSSMLEEAKVWLAVSESKCDKLRSELEETKASLNKTNESLAKVYDVVCSNIGCPNM